MGFTLSRTRITRSSWPSELPVLGKRGRADPARSFGRGGRRPASAGAATLARAATPVSPGEAQLREPFFGSHQGGIATPQQTHSYFAAFDCLAKSRDDLRTMLRGWTAAAARMSAGETARDLGKDLSVEGPDGGSALGLAPGRLTITFGFGSGLFVKDGADRYGLAARRPAALADLPKFNGDQLDPAQTGGDISVQACADDPMIAFHAVRELARLSYGAAELRWGQAGFLPQAPAGETPRNLMGFKDGTSNPPRARSDVTPDSPRSFDDVVWVGDEGPDWMRGGSYVVARRIRISLEHWDRSEIDFQEQVIGRRKYSGARSARPTNATLSTWTASTRTAIPSSPTIPMCGSEPRRPTAGRRFFAGPIPTTTASGSPRSAGPRGARA